MLDLDELDQQNRRAQDFLSAIPADSPEYLVHYASRYLQEVKAQPTEYIAEAHLHILSAFQAQKQPMAAKQWIEQHELKASSEMMGFVGKYLIDTNGADVALDWFTEYVDGHVGRIDMMYGRYFIPELMRAGYVKETVKFWAANDPLLKGEYTFKRMMRRAAQYGHAMEFVEASADMLSEPVPLALPDSPKVLEVLTGHADPEAAKIFWGQLDEATKHTTVRAAEREIRRQGDKRLIKIVERFGALHRSRQKMIHLWRDLQAWKVTGEMSPELAGIVANKLVYAGRIDEAINIWLTLDVHQNLQHNQYYAIFAAKYGFTDWAIDRMQQVKYDNPYEQKNFYLQITEAAADSLNLETIEAVLAGIPKNERQLALTLHAIQRISNKGHVELACVLIDKCIDENSKLNRNGLLRIKTVSGDHDGAARVARTFDWQGLHVLFMMRCELSLYGRATALLPELGDKSIKLVLKHTTDLIDFAREHNRSDVLTNIITYTDRWLIEGGPAVDPLRGQLEFLRARANLFLGNTEPLMLILNDPSTDSKQRYAASLYWAQWKQAADESEVISFWSTLSPAQRYEYARQKLETKQRPFRLYYELGVNAGFVAAPSLLGPVLASHTGNIR